MSEQSTSIPRDEFQNKILNLEKKYFDRIYEIISSVISYIKAKNKNKREKERRD